VRQEGFLPGDALFVRQNLKHELLGLPLKDVGHLAAEIFEQRLANAGAVAYVDPLIRAAQAINTGLLGRIAEHTGSV
jgi:hypothetical protein